MRHKKSIPWISRCQLQGIFKSRYTFIFSTSKHKCCSQPPLRKSIRGVEFNGSDGLSDCRFMLSAPQQGSYKFCATNCC